LTDEILKKFEHQIAEWTIIPGRGGVFEVTLDGELIFSKKKMGRHAAPGEIRRIFEARLPHAVTE
jgi:selenoprotein W-related protein